MKSLENVSARLFDCLQNFLIFLVCWFQSLRQIFFSILSYLYSLLGLIKLLHSLAQRTVNSVCICSFWEGFEQTLPMSQMVLTCNHHKGIHPLRIPWRILKGANDAFVASLLDQAVLPNPLSIVESELIHSSGYPKEEHFLWQYTIIPDRLDIERDVLILFWMLWLEVLDFWYFDLFSMLIIVVNYVILFGYTVIMPFSFLKLLGKCTCPLLSLPRWPCFA